MIKINKTEEELENFFKDRSQIFNDTPKENIFGYVRVSSKSQEINFSIQNQTDELMRLGVPKKNIRTETVSATGKFLERPKFMKLIDKLESGDILVVTKLDRVSRSTLDFLTLHEYLLKKKVQLIALDLPYSGNSASDKLIATTIMSMATFESERRASRQREGIEAAKKAGRYFGRPTVINKKLIDKVQYLKEEKQLSVTEIAKITGCSRTTIYKVLRKLEWVPYGRLVKKNSKNPVKAP